MIVEKNPAVVAFLKPIWMMSCVKRPSLLKRLLNFASSLHDVSTQFEGYAAENISSCQKNLIQKFFNLAKPPMMCLYGGQ